MEYGCCMGECYSCRKIRREVEMRDSKMENVPGCSSCRHLKGVVCEVTGCAYHDGVSYCTAKQIAVGPHSASSAGETLCATFKPVSL